MEQPSGNMDDTGYFSVQVISKALSLWNLDLTPINSTDSLAMEIKKTPTMAQAYIFNMENHWFCIRRFKCDLTTKPLLSTDLDSISESIAFFNLDSLLSRPDYMSGSFLTEYIKQMQNEGYSVFIVSGEFPQCSAEPLKCVPNKQPITFVDLTKSESTVTVSENDEDFQRAIQLSLDDWTKKNDRYLPNECSASTSVDGNGDDLETALKLSLECFSGKNQGSPENININAAAAAAAASNQTLTTETLTPNQLRDKRLAYFNSMSSQNE